MTNHSSAGRCSVCERPLARHNDEHCLLIAVEFGRIEAAEAAERRAIESAQVDLPIMAW